MQLFGKLNTLVASKKILFCSL